MSEAVVGHSGRWIKLILLCLAAVLVALFTVQNMGRESELSLNLWVVAYKLKAPVPIPYMLLTAFGLGLLLAGFLGIVQRMGLARKIRDLEQDTARSSLREPDDDWT